MTIHRKTYLLASWRTWDHELVAHVEDFRSRFHVVPNLLLASQITHARIDMAARNDHVLSDEGEPPEEDEYTQLYSFVGPDYELVFCIDDALPDRQVSLIYDSDPDGGGEPVPDEDTEEAVAGGSRTGTG
ncbi:MAG: hypothetical protein ACOCXM_10845 [Myxococcota bacterium]